MKNYKIYLVAAALLLTSGYLGYTNTVSAMSNPKTTSLINLKITPKNTPAKAGKNQSKTNTVKQVPVREIKSISPTSFSINIDKVNYIVSINSSTKIVNAANKKIPFSKLKAGHLVKVTGTIKPGNSVAQWVQDISI